MASHSGENELPACKWKEINRLNKEHTEKLKLLYDLRQNQPVKVVQDLKQICVCTEDAFRIGKGRRDNTDVYVGFICRDGREVAVKRVIKLLSNRVDKELDTLVDLPDHTNIVHYVVTEDSQAYSYIATELCDFDTEEWIDQRQVKDLDEKEWGKKVPVLLAGFLCGLDHLHTQDIMHRDLKPHDVLIVRSTNGEETEECLKIADFGLSLTVEPGQSGTNATGSGTDFWRPREVLQQLKKSKPPKEGIKNTDKSTPSKEEGEQTDGSKPHLRYRYTGDIQSAGMVCFYIMSQGIHPYTVDGGYIMAHHNIMNGNYNLSAVEDPVACHMVRLMLAHEPSDRPTAGELLRHAYFWSDERRYKFLAAIGDQEEVATYDPNKPQKDAVKAIERADVLPTVTTGQRTEKNWGRLGVIPELGKLFQDKFKRPGYTRSVCHLLRMMRNIQSHYEEQSENAKKILEFDRYPYAYFNAELPKLFFEIYLIIKSTAGTGDDWVQRHKLKTFFQNVDGRLVYK